MALSLKEALEVLHAGDWCSLKFITADVKKGTGGTVLAFSKCRIARNRQPIKAPASPTRSEEGNKKDPNHSYHFTRNIELPNKMLRKVHPVLITEINNQPVL